MTNEVVNALPPSAVDENIFDSGAQLRDPFWPIGFVPASAPKAAKSVGPEPGKEAADQGSDLSGMLRIGGVIKKGGRFYAIINGFTVQTGEVISAVVGDEVHRFIIKEIDFKKVQLRPLRK